MKLGNVLLGAVASLTLVGAAAGTGEAAPLHTSATPVITSVTVKVLLGSKPSPEGDFTVQIGAGPGSKGVCNFDLDRYTQAYGWQSLGNHHGTTVTESI